MYWLLLYIVFQSSSVFDSKLKQHSNIFHALDSLIRFFSPPSDSSETSRSNKLLTLWELFNGKQTYDRAITLPSGLQSIILHQYSGIFINNFPTSALEIIRLSKSSLADCTLIDSSVWTDVLVLELQINTALIDFLEHHESLLVYRRRIIEELLRLNPGFDIMIFELTWIALQLARRSDLLSRLSSSGIALSDTDSDIRVFRALLRETYSLLSGFEKRKRWR